MATKPNTPTAEDAVIIAAKMIADIDTRNAAVIDPIITNIVTRAYRIVDNYSITFGEASENESLADDLAEITETITALAVHYDIALVDCCGNPVDVHDPNGDRYAADPAARGRYAGHGLYDSRDDAVDIAYRLRELADNALHIGRDLYADVKTAQLADLAEIIAAATHDAKEVIAAATHPTDA